MLLRAAALSFALCLGCGAEGSDGEPFEPRATVLNVGADPLDGSGRESCPIYQEERCVAGTLQRCEIYDTGTGTFVEEPDPLLRRVFLYDRWYDLYESPLGLTGERVFDGPMPKDAPESEWASPSRFARWAGMGDAGIWTGAALMSDIFRYTQTRTEADYARMEEKTRTLIRSFEVTGIPGYLARYHYLKVPEGTPPDDQLIQRTGDPGPVDLPIEDSGIDGLPPQYDRGEAFWNGDVSIDQYTGPMMAFPIAYGLLKDEALKEKITHHLTCYLKRLARIEIINLKARPDLVEELWSFFGGTSLELDPDDPDISDLSELIWYVHRGINRENMDGFDRTCPEEVQLEPWRVLDARSPTFESELLELATDINRDIRTRENQIDHFYIPSIRGGDASHLIHLATIAYFLTGEEQYRRFLFDELIDRIRANEVARTMMAFRLPDWCFKFYGDHITYGTHWQLITMLPPGDLKEEMVRVMEEEAWQKALYNHNSAKFNVLYASVVPHGDREAAIETAIEQLRDFGGNGGELVAPRRTYSRDRGEIIDALPNEITLRCPTEEERNQCERGGQIFGIPLEGNTITHDCDGRPGECMMSDGKCADALASEGLPPRLRGYADFMWQRSPFKLGDAHAVEGQKQSPGRDLTEPYWLARYYGYIGEGEDQVLAWQDAGTCQE